MVAWEACCRPTQLGGLGISDLKLAGCALQTRWLWLQKTDSERAWSQLPISTEPQVQAFFRESTYTLVGDGRATLFWTYRWIQGESATDIASSLAQLVSPRTRRKQIVREALANRQWVRCISGGITMNVITEYLDLWSTLQNVILNEDRTELYGARHQTEYTL